MQRRNQAVSLQKAVQESPTLALLAGLAKDSADRLTMIRPLLPEHLSNCVKAGPIDGDRWCLLVSNNAAAAKLRQILPSICNSLADRGVKVTAIRLKIQGNVKD
jgi:hypothetical protein